MRDGEEVAAVKGKLGGGVDPVVAGRDVVEASPGVPGGGEGPLPFPVRTGTPSELGRWNVDGSVSARARRGEEGRSSCTVGISCVEVARKS